MYSVIRLISTICVFAIIFSDCMDEDGFFKEFGESSKDAFEIAVFLNEGGFGMINKMELKINGQSKVIAMKEARYENATCIKKESEILDKISQLKLVHLPEYYGCLEKDGQAFIFMELLSHSMARHYYIKWFKVTTENHIVFQKAEPVYKLGIFKQIAEAIAELHENKFVHHDIKPDNIMLTTDANGAPLVKLVDFGGTLGFGEGLTCGSEDYNDYLKNLYVAKKKTSPVEAEEIFKRDDHWKADIWAFGVLLYELIIDKESNLFEINFSVEKELESNYKKITEMVTEIAMIKKAGLDLYSDDKSVSYHETLVEIMKEREEMTLSAAEIARRFGLIIEANQKGVPKEGADKTVESLPVNLELVSDLEHLEIII
jgi:serine/threonine protein kinase